MTKMEKWFEQNPEVLQKLIAGEFILKDVANLSGASVNQVYYYLLKNNITRKIVHKRPSAAREKLLEILRDDPSILERMTLEELGRPLGITRERVRQILKEYNIKNPRTRLPGNMMYEKLQKIIDNDDLWWLRSNKDLAAEIGCYSESISSLLKKLGVSRPKFKLTPEQKRMRQLAGSRISSQVVIGMHTCPICGNEFPLTRQRQRWLKNGQYKGHCSIQCGIIAREQEYKRRGSSAGGFGWNYKYRQRKKSELNGNV